jgi:hypothetical protein
MTNLFQNTQLLRVTRAAGLFCGSLALAALMSAAPVVPAHAYVPAGLTRLDPPQSNANAFAEAEPHAKVRAHGHKNQAH